MEVRHLRLVQASQTLHLTPSALSHQLKEAEDQLGTALFLRVGRRLVITPAGQRVRELADEVVRRLDAVENEIHQQAAGEGGLIRVSTECYTSYHWLPSTLQHYRTHHPRVEVKLVLEATHAPLEALLAGDLDVAITSDPVDDPRFAYHELFQDEMLVIVPGSHGWAARRFVEPQDFAVETLIIHSLPLETVSVLQYFLGPAAVKPRDITVLPLTEAQVALVKAGMGVTVMARWAMKPYLRDRSLKAVRLGPSGLRRTHYAAVLASAPARVLEPFLEALRRDVPR